ncbi:MAG: Signal transduction histidine kinase involved in nitrogen fixation and metabolism regulation [Glomeribacter sp. 1016415]|nr:Signal transduction histidine kinase involved in nitrogen fixation and metabolism regulation [Glomeribacter sp. 1016415]
MPSKAAFTRYVVRSLLTTIAILALLLLVLLALASSANTEFFDRYYSWLYSANIAIALIFMLIVGGLIWIILARLRQGKFGARLLAKLAIFFALVGVLPGGILYLVSLQFVSRSIESWFDLNVEKALASGLDLGRGLLDNSLADLHNNGRLIASQLAAADEANLTLTLLRLREQFGVQEAIIVASTGRVVAQASPNFTALVPDDLPTPMMLRQARTTGYAGLEGELDAESTNQFTENAKGALRLRVVVRIPADYQNLARQDERFLQLTRSVQPQLARNAAEMQRAWRDYQEKALGRTGLRKMYIGTLTLALFLATFIAMMLAFGLGNQLARPLFLLAQGTLEVARGDYRQKYETNTNDELGFLMQSFNAMTRQLSEARAAVERNRVALENSKAYLESVLANLTAGVFVFDRKFRLTIANVGAERIFRQPLQGHLNCLLEEITALAGFASMVRKAFAVRDAELATAEGDRGHWQQQFEVQVQGEAEPLTLLARGTRLLLPAVEASADMAAAKSAVTAGYVVVFDDISDIISAQRSVAWGEVARRLAHEIKNPLTPIQLSAERLQMKLADKLAPADAEVLRRGATTIINQVAAMKQMVDDFREYARMPPTVLHDLQLNDLITEVLALYGVGEEKSFIQADLAPLPMIRGDPTQLRQVIHNLLQNAQDAVAEVFAPSVLIETKAVEYEHPDIPSKNGLAVRLSVMDNGSGFPARILTRAFEPYVTSKTKGTGLGLATVKKIIDEHVASISIRNRPPADGASTGASGAQISILFLQLAESELEPHTGKLISSKIEQIARQQTKVV